MATPTPNLHIKSAARKLPIKRKSLLQPHDPHPLSSSDPAPNPNPNPNPNPIDPSAAADSGVYDDYDDEEDADEESDVGGGGGSGGGEAASSCGGSSGVKPPPPFKFHRIWSESDEIRFLQGLLGCFSQGMVFPRDLNLFYDRFSESMPQPYTRSQLSEKLRRLRKKYRVMSARVARGQDPSRLVPHDRDLLHLCTRLWHPSYAASSPFVSTPDGASSAGNKRRRPNPRGPSGRAPDTAVPSVPTATAAVALVPSSITPSQPHLTPHATLALPAPVPALIVTAAPPIASRAPTPAAYVAGHLNEGNPATDSHNSGADEDKKPLLPPTPASNAAAGKVDTKQLLAKTVLDVFDGSLNELRTCMGSGMFQVEEQSGNLILTDITKKWREQRLTELDVMARRLRLVLEDSLRS